MSRLSFLDEISLDNPKEDCITEGYTEAAYLHFADGETPNFYLPPSASWYVKAALRDRFPGAPLPSVVEIENMLIDRGELPPRDLTGRSLYPPLHLWPPRQRRTRACPEE